MASLHYFSLLLATHFIKLCLGCQEESLLWYEKIATGFSSYELQVCCDVERLWAARIKPGWDLGSAVFDNVPLKNLSLPGSELVISKCDDGTVTPGYVPAVWDGETRYECTQKMGHNVLIQPEFRKFHFLMDAWYALCWQTNSGCRLCSIERFCSNDFAESCARVWLQRSVSVVSNDSMTFWVRIGEKLPFPASLKVQVFDQKLPDSQPIDKWFQASVVKNSTSEFELMNLEPNSWYRVQTCLEVSAPDRFRRSIHNGVMEQKQTICAEDVSYRTRGYNSVSALSSNLVVLFVVFVIHRLA